MRVYLNTNKHGGKKIVDAELLEENEKTVTVRLPNGDVIKRKKLTQVVKEEV